MQQIIDLSASGYQPHRLHSQERDWAETNCYVDIWIELLHGLGHEPLAMLPFTLSIDFEDDQWTFFKPSITDLFELYGLEVQEMAVWRPLVEHVQEQLAHGKPVLVELDSWNLPDTEGSAYHLAHVKSTVAINRFDLEHQFMGYFHGQGYYELEGQDFTDVFYLGQPDPARLPPYVEIIKRHPSPASNAAELMEISRGLLPRHRRLIPEHNPFERFQERFAADLDFLMQADLELFHAYSFATFRQFGACYELAANYLQWLEDLGERRFIETREQLRAISTTSKVYQFQLARAIMRKKPLDLAPIRQMAELWENAIERLHQAL